MREFLGASLNDCLSIKLGSSHANAKKNWWLFWRRVCFVNWVPSVLVERQPRFYLPYRWLVSVVHKTADCAGQKAKQVTFLAEDWSCLFLTESLCKQQLLIISEQALPSRLSGSHQQAVIDGCEQRGRKTTLFPGSAIFHVEVMV